ncbi:MAG: hypothetical protein ACLQUZ_01280 [Rhizomicrobium sp.]
MAFRGYQIIETDEFRQAVEEIGGYRFVDAALSTIMDGLRRNPFGFHRFESQFVSFRYARTKPIGMVPPLTVIFRIEEPETIYLEHIEEDEIPY